MTPLKKPGTRTWKRPVIKLQTASTTTNPVKLTNNTGCSTCNKRRQQGK